MCQGELSCHVRQVTLLRVTLHPHVSVILHFWRMRPVLVALGLQVYDNNRQITLHLMWIMSQDTIYNCCYICCPRLSWNQTRGAFHPTDWGTKAIHQEQDVNWLSMCVQSSRREKTRGTWQIINQLMLSIWLPSNRQGETETSSLETTLMRRCCCLGVNVSSSSDDLSNFHPAHTLHLASRHSVKPCYYSQLCRLIVSVCKHPHLSL